MKNNLMIIYGGSFNPPSLAHITLATQLLRSLGAKELLFIPVGDHYKKKELVAACHRVNMLKLAIGQDSRLSVSTIEIDTQKRLYTIETLDKLKKRYPKSDLCFLMGTDNLRDITYWKDWERLISEYKIIVMDRGEDTLWQVLDDIKVLKSYKSSFIQIPGLLQSTISSTMIRNNIKAKRNIGHLTTVEIVKYIKKENLYLD
ncbi:MAG: nicotinate-nucleotide adenylyltransferase [Clostridium sp.]|jgi:nicotinate-nucleotide adenylyltransferase